MGCGPSKDANVATGNMVTSESLLQKNSDESSNAESSLTTTTVTASVAEDKNTVEEEGKGSEDVEVKDMAPEEGLSAPTTLEGEGKLIVAGSPDHYFSSRKDEEAVEGVTASTGYFSPLPEILSGENDEEVEAEKAVSEEEGKTSSIDSGDLKEAILVEEKEAKAKVTEKENGGEEESA